MLKLEALSYRYAGAGADALSNVRLQLRPGQILGLLGPNGAGKSTLLALLSGLLPLNAGRITLDGQDLANSRRVAPTRIGLAPQSLAFYPALTVQQNLQCFAGAAGLSGGKARERINACLALGQLQERARSAAQELSGGMQRRLNLAIALLAQPQYLLLDEPTVGVDPQSRAFLMDAVRALARAGHGVLYTSHYMEEVEAIADDVAIMDQGRVLAHGALDELLRAHAPTLQATILGMPDEQAVHAAQAFGLARCEQGRFELQLHEQTSGVRALVALEQSGAKVIEARFGRGDLESLFMSLTQRSLRD